MLPGQDDKFQALLLPGMGIMVLHSGRDNTRFSYLIFFFRINFGPYHSQKPVRVNINRVRPIMEV